jgi:sulfotransferase
MKHKFFGIAGLPRTGSTLLSCILNQNPTIHCEGSSSLGTIMFHNYGLLEESMINLSRKRDLIESLLAQLPEVYYTGIKKPIIFDKNRSWSMGINYGMFKSYLNPEGKIIILYRDVVEILKSFTFIAKEAGWEDKKIWVLLESMVDITNGPIFLDLSGIVYNRTNNIANTLYISYNGMVHNTRDTIKEIYNFCDLPYFEHDFENIVNEFPEDDENFGIVGQHDVRRNISQRTTNDVVLPDRLHEMALMFNQQLNTLGLLV